MKNEQLHTFHYNFVLQKTKLKVRFSSNTHRHRKAVSDIFLTLSTLYRLRNNKFRIQYISVRLDPAWIISFLDIFRIRNAWLKKRDVVVYNREKKIWITPALPLSLGRNRCQPELFIRFPRYWTDAIEQMTDSLAHPAGNYMFKVNNRNTRIRVWNMFKVNNKNAIGVVLVSLLSTLNIFYTLF